MNSANELGGVSKPFFDDEEEDGFDLLELWYVFRRNIWIILAFAFASAMLAFLVASAMTPIYSSSAKLLIETRQQNIVSIEELYVDSRAREYFQTQLEIMTSRPLIERVVEQLDLTNHVEFDPRQEAPSLISKFRFWSSEKKEINVREEAVVRSAVSRVIANLSVQPVPNTTIVRIGFESSDPELAQRVPNAVGNAFIDDNLESRVALTQRAASWLTERLGGLRQKLDESERALQEYREKEDLVDVSGVETLAARELSELSSRLVVSRKRVAEARTQLETIDGDGVGTFQRTWETLPSVVRDSLSQQLKSEERRAASNFSDIQQRYGPKHPKYIAANAQLASATEAYFSRVEKVVSGFEAEYKSALADQRELEHAVDLARQQTQELNRKRFELSELDRQVETNRQLYDLFFRRFQETNAASFESANARFVDEALRPGAPVKPRRMYIALLAAVLSSIVGVGLALLREVLDNTVRSAEEVEHKLRQPMLGILPFEKSVDDRGAPASQLYSSTEHFAFAEAVRSVRTSVVLSSVDNPHRVLVVTSSVPGEGKTTVASNLALTLGQMEKVLLIDADMRRPSLSSDYELGENIKGLSELVANTASAKECIYRLPERGIDVLPAGSIPPNPLDLLSSQRFAKLLHTLRQSYDRIIIDSAPTQSVSDSLVLSKYADGLVYVVKSDATAVSIIRNGMQRLERVGAPLIGVVLNQFDPGTSSRFGYQGSGYYGYGYASKSYS